MATLSQHDPTVSHHDPTVASDGWRRRRTNQSLSELFCTVATRPQGSIGKKLLAFLGPGYLVAVGYMDPGNWATSLAGGSKFGYALLVIALLSNVMAILLQALCARLGIGAGRDLAQACSDAFPRALSWPLWLLAEIAIWASAGSNPSWWLCSASSLPVLPFRLRSRTPIGAR